MGIIKQQSTQSTIYNYLGVIIGFLNFAILFPKLLSEQQVGLLSFLHSLSDTFAGIFTLGMPLVGIKFFPRLRNESNGIQGYFAFLLLATLLGCFLSVFLFWGVKDWLISENSSLHDFSPFIIACATLIVLRIFYKNFDNYIQMQLNTVLSTFLENIVLKCIIFIALGYYYWIDDSFLVFFFLYTFALALPGVAIMGYIFSKGQFSLKLRSFIQASRKWRKEILNTSIHGVLGILGVIIVHQLGTIMVANMMGLKHVAIYKTAYLFGIFCSIPGHGLERISVVILAEAWKKNDLNTIKGIYHKSHLTLFLIGVYLFLGVWVNIDYVFEILPASYAAGKVVILIIGITELMSLANGVSTQIISSSPYYKYNTYFTAVLIAFLILFNYLLIPVLGIEGSAIASLCSLAIYNALKFIFLKKRLKYQPFNYKMILTLLIAGGALAMITYVLPTFENIYLGILITGGALTIIYWIPVYLLKISTDINQTIDSYIK